MNRPGGIPIIFWIAGLVAGVGGFTWLRKRQGGGTASPATAGKTGQPAFSQAQEVQDFQIFSSLTSAQQGSDLNFLSEVAGLLGGGASPTTNIPGPAGPAGAVGPAGPGGPAGPAGSGVPSPAPTGTAPPATVPASSLPGYGAGLGTLIQQNPGIIAANSPGGPNIPGITGYQASYNGVPI